MKLLNNSIYVGSSFLIASSLVIKPALSDQYFQSVETDAGKTYCIGIERGFLDWPGPQFSDGGNEGKWSLDDQDWYVGYQTTKIRNETCICPARKTEKERPANRFVH